MISLRRSKKGLPNKTFQTFLLLNCSVFKLKQGDRSWSYQNFQRSYVWNVLGQVKSKNMFSETIHKIFETNTSSHLKQRNTRKFNFCFCRVFLLVLTNFDFWQEQWALGYHLMKFRQFLDISKFPQIFSLKPFPTCDASHNYDIQK